MSINASNITQSLATALKGIPDTEDIEAKKDGEETPAKTVAKAVAVSISTQPRCWC